jgi:transcriptional regulator with XRE-family HTH domain
MSVCGHAHVRCDRQRQVTTAPRPLGAQPIPSGDIRHASSFAAATLQALRRQGLTYSEIARRTGYERRSIANWLTSNAPRDRNRAALNPTSPRAFGQESFEIPENGNRVGRHLFYDIKNRGYTGSRSNLDRLLKVWREVENIQPDDPPPDVDVSEPVRDPDTGHMISSVVAAALCIKPRGLLTDRQAGKGQCLETGFDSLRQNAWPGHGSTVYLIPSSRRSRASPAFCAGI